MCHFDPRPLTTELSQRGVTTTNANLLIALKCAHLIWPGADDFCLLFSTVTKLVFV